MSRPDSEQYLERIYNIYIFLNNFYDKRTVDGGMNGFTHVLFSGLR